MINSAYLVLQTTACILSVTAKYLSLHELCSGVSPASQVYNVHTEKNMLLLLLLSLEKAQTVPRLLLLLALNCVVSLFSTWPLSERPREATTVNHSAFSSFADGTFSYTYTCRSSENKRVVSIDSPCSYCALCRQHTHAL